MLASGDPLFYGVARYLCDKLGKDRFEVVPHVSSMQLAFARVKESWEEAYLTNLANRPLDQVIEKIRVADKVGPVHERRLPAAAVAKALLDRRIDYFSAYVCENLGSPDERVTQGELAEIAAQEFSPLERDDPGAASRTCPTGPARRSAAGCSAIRTKRFCNRSPSTGCSRRPKCARSRWREMDLGPTSIVWDIGAGSGSVAIEAAQIAAGGTVYAIEMDPEDHAADHGQRRAVRRDATWWPCSAGRPRPGPTCPTPTHLRRRQRPRDQPTSSSWPIERLRPGGRLVANVGSIENLVDVHDTLHARWPATSTCG